jgi:hypothetical protein
MKHATKQARITADFFAGNITAKRAAKLAKRAKRAAINRGRKSRKVWK